MCGRFSLDATPQELVDAFALAEAIAFERRYNIAPTQNVPVVRVDPEAGDRRAAMLRWGMATPSFGGARPLINARSESIDRKPSFADAFRQRRCVVPARGFFEWQKLGAAKQPFHIQRRDGGLLAFAGLWERGGGEEGELPESFVILTTAPNRTIEGIHDRMPAILDRRGWEAWLDSQGPPQRLHELLGPAPDDLLEAYPVSRRVNGTANDDRACVERLARHSDTFIEELF
jgi:putative SOS response-associated peptidase YedK